MIIVYLRFLVELELFERFGVYKIIIFLFILLLIFEKVGVIYDLILENFILERVYFCLLCLLFSFYFVKCLIILDWFFFIVMLKVIKVIELKV